MTILLYSMLALFSIGFLSLRGKDRATMSTASILAVSVLFAAYSMFLSASGFDLYGDRANYALHYAVYYSRFLDHPLDAVFDGFQQPGWAAVNIVLRCLTPEVKYLLTLTVFLYMLTSLLLVREASDDGKNAAALFFLVSFGPLYAMSQCRQFFAIALCNLAYIYYLRKSKYWLIPALLAVTVHSSSLIMLAVVAISKFARTRNGAAWVLLLGFSVALFSGAAIDLAVAALPFLGKTMPGSVSGASEGLGVVVKSLPYLIVAFIAFPTKKMKSSLKSSWNDELSWTSAVVAACAYIASAVNYWFCRMSFYCIPLAGACFSNALAAREGDRFPWAVLVIAVSAVLTLRELSMLYPMAL